MTEPQPNVVCAYCDIPIYRKPFTVKQSATGLFYCSKVHKGLAMVKDRVPNVVCAYCEMPFWRKETSIQNSKSGLVFCSSEHQHLAFKHESGIAVTSGPKQTSFRLSDAQRIQKAKQSRKLSGKKFDCLLCHNSFNEEVMWEEGYCYKCSYIPRWLRGEETGTSSNTNEMVGIVRKYIRNLKGEKCWECGWNEINPTTGRIPVQIDHIDGDSGNNIFSNLQVLCPNHHSLTATFGNNGGRAGKSGRITRYKKV